MKFFSIIIILLLFSACTSTAPQEKKTVDILDLIEKSKSSNLAREVKNDSNRTNEESNVVVSKIIPSKISTEGTEKEISANGSQDGKQSLKQQLITFCKQPFALLSSKNVLEQLVEECNWNIEYILKINELTHLADFARHRPVTLPAAVQKRAFEKNLRPENISRVNCGSSYAIVDKGHTLTNIANQCDWNIEQMTIINGYQRMDEDLYIGQTLLTPEIITELKRKMRLQSESIQPDAQQNSSVDRLSVSTQRNTFEQLSTGSSANNFPSYCTYDKYVLKAPILLSQLAAKCGFNPRYLAHLNQSKANKKFQTSDVVLFPAIVNKDVKKRAFKKPFPVKNCSKKYHKVKAGENIAKIAIACQWDYRHLLTLNKMKANQILEVGQKLLFPNALYLRGREKSVLKTDVGNKNESPIKIASFSRMLKKEDCIRSVWRVFSNTTVDEIATVCGWKRENLMLLNGWDTNNRLIKREVILLPKIFELVRKRYKVGVESEDKRRKSKPSSECNKKRITSQKDIALQTIAEKCGWHIQYLLLLNDLTPQQRDTKRSQYVLPPILSNSPS